MKIHEMLTSKFLKKEDVDPAVLVTISHIDKVNVAVEGADPEYKYAMNFTELDKPMVLNSTNIQLAAKATGSEDTDNWTGKQIVLYNDPNVSFAGKITGGIRIRAPKLKTVPINKTVQQGNAMRALQEMEDDIPF